MKRTYVPRALNDRLCERFAKIAQSVKLGAFDEADVQIGPIQNQKQFDRITELVAEAERRQAPYYKGAIPNRDGYFFPITLFKDLPEDCRLVTEEQFGPALPLIPYDVIEDAIAKANDSVYGLGASVWGQDIDAAQIVAARLQAGNVFVNQHPSMGPDIPYGGIRHSGIGVECGLEGLAAYTNTVVLNVKKPPVRVEPD
jgi:acyl-CoA reductase-like NAD-dependent aldehyde dehydrogenase